MPEDFIYLRATPADALPLSTLAAQVFLAARIVYIPAYIFGIVGLRTGVWLIGFLATLLLYFLAL